MLNHYIAIPRPHPAEGVGRALQSAFPDQSKMPVEWNVWLDRLDRVRD